MIKKFYTLSLVATMLAGFSMVAAQQPSEARGNCQQNFSSNQFVNHAANRFDPYYNDRFSNVYGNQYFNNGFGNVRNSQRQAVKQQRKLAQKTRRQQLAAAGLLPVNNNLFNANNQLLVGNGAYNQSASPAYNQGFQAGVNSANNTNGLLNNGFGVNALTGYNGLGGLNNLNGTNGVTGYLNNGSGVSSILGRVLNGF